MIIDSQCKNLLYIAKAFLALQSQSAVADVLVLFASHHLADLREYLDQLDEDGKYKSRSYKISPVFAVPGWTILTTLGIDEKVDVVSLCTKQASLLFVGSGCAQLEMIVAKKLVRK